MTISTNKIKIAPGHLLVANPLNPKDDLSRSVMLLVSHTPKMSVALQINNPVEDINLQTVAEGLGIQYLFPDPLYYGGSSNTHKIHVVHSAEWKGLSTVKLNNEIAVTSDISVIEAIAAGDGPDMFRACAGYWAWHEGLLETQLDPRSSEDPHKWEVTPATRENVFNGEGPDQWRFTLEDSARYQVGEWF